MAKNQPLPSIDVLRQLIRYEPKSNKLFWRERGPEGFSNPSRMKTWNARYAGKEAFCRDRGHGYLGGRLFEQPMKAHRVIWALAFGEWPKGQIDHINGDRKDNRLENLRVVTGHENARNKSHQKNNTSGVMGVHWRSDNRKWSAQITINRRRIRLGDFDTLEAATAARKHAERSLGFHQNHGRQAIQAAADVLSGIPQPGDVQRACTGKKRGVQ